MRGRPEEDDCEQHPRGCREIVAHGRPPHEYRNRARSTADDDVLRGPGLEPQRVHEDVEQRRTHREQCCEQVRCGREQYEGDDIQRDAEHERGRRRDLTLRKRTAVRAAHQLVAVPLEQSIVQHLFRESHRPVVEEPLLLRQSKVHQTSSFKC